MRGLLLLFLALPVKAQVTLTQFCGVNDALSPAAIQDCEARYAIDVEPNRTDTGLKKRDGFNSLIAISSLGVRVNSTFAWKSQDGNENYLILDSSGILFRSQNLGTATHLSTVTSGAFMYCSDSDGKAYCYTSANDQPFKYDGTTFTDLPSNNAGYPNGKFSILTQDRQLVSGTTNFPNTVYISKSGDVEDFVPNSDAIDPWTEDIGTAGDKVTGLAFLNGRIIIFKEYSIGALNLTDQFNSVYYDISFKIGMSDPRGYAISEGILFFKGSDGHFYALDGSPGGVRRLSEKISKTVATFISGKARSILLTEKPDWDGGDLTELATGFPVNSSIVQGSILPSSTTFTDESSVHFASGTLDTYLSTSTRDGWITFSTGQYLIANGDAETGVLSEWTCTEVVNGSPDDTNDICSVTDESPVSGTYSFRVLSACGSGVPNKYIKAIILDADDNQVYEESGADNCISGCSIDTEALGLSTTTMKFRFEAFGGGDADKQRLTSSTFTAVRNIYWTNNDQVNCPFGLNQVDTIQVDRWFPVRMSSHVARFVSREYDTTLDGPTMGPVLVSSTAANLDGPISFQTRSSSESGVYHTTWIDVTPGNRATSDLRYQQYAASFSFRTSTGLMPMLDRVDLTASTTAQYETKCLEPGPGNTAWGTVDIDGEFLAGGYFTFEDRSADDCDSFGGYTSASTGTTVARTVKPAYQARITFKLGSATDTARVDSLTLNWQEGTVAPPSFASAWEGSVYFSVSTGTEYNNRVYRYDINQDSWWPFSLGMNSPVVFKNELIFGDVLNPRAATFSSQDPDSAPTTDAGTTYEAFWRSKLFSMGDPWKDSEFKEVSVLTTKKSAGTLNVGWSVDDLYSGNYDVPLSTGAAMVRSVYRIPIGQTGGFGDVSLKSTGSNTFELFGLRIMGRQWPMKPLP